MEKTITSRKEAMALMKTMTLALVFKNMKPLETLLEFLELHYPDAHQHLVDKGLDDVEEDPMAFFAMKEICTDEAFEELMEHGKMLKEKREREGKPTISAKKNRFDLL